MLLVSMDRHLGVAVRREPVSSGLELAAQLAEVVDLAVAHGDDLAVLARDRLVTARNVDDRKATHPEQQVAVRKGTGVVWAAVHDGIAHAREHCRVMPASDRRARGCRRCRTCRRPTPGTSRPAVRPVA